MGEKRSSDPSTPANLYLIFYNIFLCLGWLVLLVQTVHHLAFEPGNLVGLWEETNNVLKIFQTLAILEVVHAAVGLVPSGVGVVLPQVSSRLMVLWPVMTAVDQTHNSVGLPMCLIAWSVTEVIRYAFYFLNILKQVPHALVYLRYTLFIVLYPLGVTGEMLCVYTALPFVARTQMFSLTFPNTMNFTFDFHTVLILFCLMYIPFFPMLYMHMFRQRKKVLGGSKEKMN